MCVCVWPADILLIKEETVSLVGNSHHVPKHCFIPCGAFCLDAAHTHTDEGVFQRGWGVCVHYDLSPSSRCQSAAGVKGHRVAHTSKNLLFCPTPCVQMVVSLSLSLWRDTNKQKMWEKQEECTHRANSELKGPRAKTQRTEEEDETFGCVSVLTFKQHKLIKKANLNWSHTPLTSFH